jgi:hypothetical protein
MQTKKPVQITHMNITKNPAEKQLSGCPMNTRRRTALN